ncbi:hypothetical protein ATCC90586_003352 [Pythium insidiosum]|nr:hypothetical protein ATCC90586_003352 [Pythium insidiosum]
MKLAYFAATVLIAIIGAAPTTQGYCWECIDCGNDCDEKAEACGEAGHTDCTIWMSVCRAGCALGRRCRC